MANPTNEKVVPNKTYRNSNGQDYHCIRVKGDYALFQGKGKFIVAWLPTIYEDGNMAWQQGHYFELYFNPDALTNANKFLDERGK